jgi:hypothetical protein
MSYLNRAIRNACSHLTAFVVAGAFLIVPVMANAGEIESSLARGGQLYDK